MYKLHELKIVPNGLNLAPPTDQIAAGDCLALTGFWPSSVGKLQQTPGWTQRNPTPAGQMITAISETNQRVYYGSSTNLYQVGRDAAAVTIDSGFDGSPLGLLGFQGFMWIMNRTKQRRDNGTTVTNWAMEVPSIPTGSTAATGGTLDDGDYDYYVTFLDLDLNESNPSPVLTITSAGGNLSVNTINRPTASVPANILRWNVYRRSQVTSLIQQLNFGTILPYATTSYLDFGDLEHAQTDADLTGNGVILEDDHDAPPACRVLCNQPFNDRLIVASSANYPNRLWYTKANQPAYFPTLQYVDVGADRGDAILGISVRKGYFIIYRQRSIWWHVGDFDDPNPRLEPLVPDKGTLGQNSWCSGSDGDYFAWGDGIYHLADWARKISRKIQPIFERYDLETYRIARLSTLGTAALGINGGRLWFSYQEEPVASEVIRQTMLYDIEGDRWFAKGGSTFGIALDTAGAGCYYRGSAFFYGGGQSGKLMSLEDGPIDGDALVAMSYQSAYEDCGFPDREKTWGDLVLTHNTKTATLTVIVRTNNLRTGGGVDTFTLTTITSAVLTRQIIPMVYPAGYAVVAKRGLPIKSLNASIRIDGYGPAGGFAEIDTPILLHYYLEARKGVTFDSGITDHGAPEVKTVDQVEIDIDATDGAATLQIWSDLPGYVVVVRLGAGTAIPATTGRQIVKIVLASKLDGRLFRYQVLTTTGVQVYGFRSRVLVCGTYVDGVVGQIWETEPLAAG